MDKSIVDNGDEGDDEKEFKTLFDALPDILQNAPFPEVSSSSICQTRRLVFDDNLKRCTWKEMNKSTHGRGITIRDRFGSLAINGTITVRPDGCAYLNRALYTGQCLGDMFPLGEFLHGSDAKTWKSNSFRKSYITLQRKKDKQYLTVPHTSDIHFTSRMEFSEDIDVCDCGLMDDSSVMVIRDLLYDFEGEAVSESCPIKLVCYLGNWKLIE